MTSLNPVFTIGNQLMEAIMLHTKRNRKQAKERAIEMLRLVNINEPEKRMKQYPFEFSGGMRQRIVIAIALSANPDILICDEPTTALDVTIQSQILKLLKKVQGECGASIMLITHDLGIIAEMADYVVVMYAGRIIEKGTVEEIFNNPMHPYTIGLQKSKPTMDSDSDTLFNIPGNVPNPINIPDECLFKGRCDRRCAECEGKSYPREIKISPTHSVFCHLCEEKGGDN